MEDIYNNVSLEEEEYLRMEKPPSELTNYEIEEILSELDDWSCWEVKFGRKIPKEYTTRKRKLLKELRNR